jgi:tetratricopeptide (TPR) repeat protein
MQKLAVLALFLGVPVVGAFAVPQNSVPPKVSAATQLTPAEQRIAAATQQIAKDAKHTEAYTDLVLAYIRRARETGNSAWYEQADAALANGLRVTPGDFQLEKASVALLLARQRFAEALAKARQLNQKNLDDVTVYGYMAEADLALGKYADADTAAQWMLNMRPNNIAGLLLGAELRVIYGDAPGALEFLNQAFGETPQTETEELCSIANRIAIVELESGQPTRAQQALARAEELFPHSPLTTENLARVLLAQQKPGEAAALLEQRLVSEARPMRHSHALWSGRGLRWLRPPMTTPI